MLFTIKRTSCLAVAAVGLAWVQGVAAEDQCFGFYKGGLGHACQQNATVSGCCPLGNICYDNGLCKPGPEAVAQDKAKGISEYFSTYFLAGCTDSTFDSEVCTAAKFCSQFDNGNGNGIRDCTNLGPNVFCCYGTSRPGCECINEDPRVFTIGSSAPTPITTLPLSLPSYLAGSSGDGNSTASTTSSSEESESTSTSTTESIVATTVVTTSTAPLVSPSYLTSTSVSSQGPASSTTSAPTVSISPFNASPKLQPMGMEQGWVVTLLLGLIATFNL